MENTVDFRANGKLLISAEYLVLLGATALAFPVRFGQQIRIKPIAEQYIRWISEDTGGIWFEAIIGLKGDGTIPIKGEASNLPERLLKAVWKIKPDFLTGHGGYQVNVTANYPVEWGLGSSSSLISLVAQWAGVDDYLLYRHVSNGSGYDLACATRNDLFFYTLQDKKPTITPAVAGKALTDHACFVYLGHKQDTQQEVDSFLLHQKVKTGDIEKVNELSTLICGENDPAILCKLVNDHEKLLSNLLNKKPLSSEFPWFPGVIKSLGAWGGDFAMFVSAMEQAKLKPLLQQNGLHTIFTFNELKVK